MLRLLLFFQIFYTVYELHFPFTTDFAGLNLVNLLFLGTLAAIVVRSGHDPVKSPAMLRGALLLFFVVLVVAYAIAQARSPLAGSDDLPYLKNAIFYPLLYFVYLHCRQDLKTTRLLIIFVLVISAVAGLQAVRQGLA